MPAIKKVFLLEKKKFDFVMMRFLTNNGYEVVSSEHIDSIIELMGPDKGLVVTNYGFEKFCDLKRRGFSVVVYCVHKEKREGLQRRGFGVLGFKFGHEEFKMAVEAALKKAGA